MWVTKEADDYVIQIRQFILSLGLGAGQESNWEVEWHFFNV